ncbi:hypothetical protein AKJ16_DCAP18118, partial [Drosera capensis]
MTSGLRVLRSWWRHSWVRGGSGSAWTGSGCWAEPILSAATSADNSSTSRLALKAGLKRVIDFFPTRVFWCHTFPLDYHLSNWVVVAEDSALIKDSKSLAMEPNVLLWRSDRQQPGTYSHWITIDQSTRSPEERWVVTVQKELDWKYVVETLMIGTNYEFPAKQ